MLLGTYWYSFCCQALFVTFAKDLLPEMSIFSWYFEEKYFSRKYVQNDFGKTKVFLAKLSQASESLRYSVLRVQIKIVTSDLLYDGFIAKNSILWPFWKNSVPFSALKPGNTEVTFRKLWVT